MAYFYCGRYAKLERLQLSESILREYNYPRQHPTTLGKAVASNARQNYAVIPSQMSRRCRRCDIIYAVHKDGRAVRPERCLYHSFRAPPLGYKYRCCSGDRSAKPCKSAEMHVHENVDLDNLTGFLMTKTNTLVTKKAAYALDCEMIYTNGGLEIAAISVVDVDWEVVYETKVIPDNRILDYNTEFSGLKASDFNGVTTTMNDVHNKFLSLFGPNTILVGHGLANDLLRLRIIHDRVVDTMVLYPHKRGLPLVNNLKYLKENFLSYDGSCSNACKCRGDAKAAMKLALRRA